MITPQQRFRTCQKFLALLVPLFCLLVCLSGCTQPQDVPPPNPENFPIVFDDTLAKSIPHHPGEGRYAGKDIYEITGKDAVIVLRKAGRSIPCGMCGRIADPSHPNRQEVVQEDGYFQVWDGGCQCYRTYHYHDDARQVCCYWANRGESGYAWMGLDGQERYLSKAKAAKPAPTCKEEIAQPVKTPTEQTEDAAARGAARGAAGAYFTHKVLDWYWNSTDAGPSLF
jgi:hypothetical protein